MAPEWRAGIISLDLGFCSESLHTHLFPLLKN
ncbi:hypothetical protein T4B_13696 [Trichinella pseudospiralis]|uniref:Uncharacterized protein n=1 Tax=Trichinella pseudospiralis TaxID=6337 RepID=A0A0V1G9R7_TRIPS|nr:hypothetical protein T4B_11045 [Trichinella pseudospiralis]KRY94976.1 hypothetical protein T4B_13696 [Trichinella pseudospiralis]